MAMATVSAGWDERTPQERLDHNVAEARENLQAAPDVATTNPDDAITSIFFIVSRLLKHWELKARNIEPDLDLSAIWEIADFARKQFEQVKTNIASSGITPDEMTKELITDFETMLERFKRIQESIFGVASATSGGTVINNPEEAER